MPGDNRKVNETSLSHSWLPILISAMGILGKKQSNVIENIIRRLKPLVVFLHLLAFHSIFTLLKSATTNYSQVSSLIANIISLLLWYIIQLRGDYLLQAFKSILKLEKATGIGNNSRNWSLNLTFLLIFAIPMVFSAGKIYAYIEDRDEFDPKFWLWGHEFPDNLAMEGALIFLSVYVYFSVYLTPCFLSSIYGMFCKVVKKGIERNSQRRNVTDEDLLKCLQFRYLILICCKEIEKCFTFPAALILIQYASSIFTAIALFSTHGFASVNALAEIAVTLVTSSIFFSGIIIFASDIPQTMRKARLQYQVLYRVEVIDHYKSSRERLLMLKVLSEIEIIYLSACDSLTFDRSLIISSAGCFLTYGFLLLSSS